MKKRSVVAASIFLRLVVVFLGLGALAFLLWEPHVEGRNANAGLVDIYFRDPLLAYAYVGSIPFFVGLYQAIRALGWVAQGRALSSATLKALRIIRKCAVLVVGFILVGELFLLLEESDDRAGGVAIGVVLTFASVVVVASVSVIERILEEGLEMKMGGSGVLV
ncbi:MAG: DUF2975 domain-containing protein [Limisphaerales bacterium]|jgi:hypothetical protein